MDDGKSYNKAMIASYSVRTAAESSAYMLHILKPDMHVLDVGSGPGTISLDLAAHVPQGKLTGVDASSTAVESAIALGEERGVTNASFVTGDALELPFDDNTFDVVHCHQVLGHLPGQEGEPGPVRGLKEMRRVCKPGGFVCAREAEWSSFVVYPDIPGTVESLNLLEKLQKHGGKTVAGGRGKEFARRAGFAASDITASAATVTYSTPGELEWWGQTMAKRLEASNSRAKGIELGFITGEEGAKMPQAWRDWASNEDAFSCRFDGQIICKK
ncbi:methyltransferase type 11 [Xylariaceae sp. FL1272]|nr:methyltransferase type 11 [Xylariaceae sp. FL1272]